MSEPSTTTSARNRNCAKISVSDQRSAGWFVPSRSVGMPARHGVNRDGSRAAVVVAADVAPLSSTNTNIVRSGESVQEVPKRPRIGGFGVNRCHYQNSASQSVSGNDRNCAKISVSDQRSAGWFVPSRSVGTPAEQHEHEHRAVRGECPGGPEAATNRRFRCQSVPLSKQCQPISVRERSKLCQDQRERSAISGLVCAITIGWDAGEAWR